MDGSPDSSPALDPTDDIIYPELPPVDPFAERPVPPLLPPPAALDPDHCQNCRGLIAAGTRHVVMEAGACRVDLAT